MTTIPGLETVRVGVDAVSPHPANPREGDVGAIAESLTAHGQYRPIVVQQSTGHVLAGNHTLLAARSLGWESIDAVYVDVDDEQAARILVVDNRTSDLARYHEDALAALLTDLAQQSELGLAGTGFDADALDSLLADLAMPTPQPIDTTVKLNPRKSGLDLIYSLYPGHPWSFMAKYSGWLLGAMSSLSVFNPENVEWWSRKQTVSFIDNEWHGYDHAKHADVVSRIRPKYATVRDLVTQSQAQAADIEWYSIEQVLDWADEIDGYAENTIVIPKYDCIDLIPERFMLGYSLPSSYGRTELPLEAFKGRRVHLLGGSWTHQRAALATLGDDVVSLDNNSIGQAARFGQFAMPDGTRKHISQDLGLPIVNSQLVCIALSLGNIARAAHDLYPEQTPPAPLSDLDTDDDAALVANRRSEEGDE